MNTIYTTSNRLPDTSRVWIYQAQQPFTEVQTVAIAADVQRFVEQWTSHNQALRAKGIVQHRQFIILIVDESQAGASGCSIDKSVHFLQALEGKYGVNLFDRMCFTYKIGEDIHTATHDEFATLYAQGNIDDHTLVFDNLVKTKGELDTEWLKPLGQSWHKRMV